MWLASVLRVPPADKPVARWHVSAPMDLIGYAFSWLWVLIPLAMLGATRPDYMIWYLIVIAATDVHRHYGLPYVYMDKKIRRQYPLRFGLLPLVLFAAWILSPGLVKQGPSLTGAQLGALLAWLLALVQLLRRDGGEHAIGFGAALMTVLFSFLPALTLSALIPGRTVDPGWWWFATPLLLSVWMARSARSVMPGVIIAIGIAATVWNPEISGFSGGRGMTMKDVIAAVAVFAGLWNFYHVYMQKYGILRLYNAKSGSEKKVGPWTDKLMLFAWLPLYFAYIAPAYREQAIRNLHQVSQYLPDVIDFLARIQPVFLPLSIVIVVAAVANWIRTEWQVNRLRNMPRLSMFIGQNLLAASFLVFDPVKIYLAFAFSHAVEYMIFVWAFQRRKYLNPLPHKPLLGRVLKHPATTYMLFTFGLAWFFLYTKFWGTYIKPQPGTKMPMAFGHPTAIWLLYWGIYQSMVHFYFDGFLWKMRSKKVRANI